MEVRKEVQRAWQFLSERQRRWVRWAARQYSNAILRSHAIIVLSLVRGSGPKQIATHLNCGRSTVYRVADKFLAEGDQGLIDRREDNGAGKVSWYYEWNITRCVAGSPQDHGFHRPTWTLELLVRVLHKQTGIRLCRSTLSRHLKRLGIRRGRPKPSVGCPWSVPKKRRKLARIRRLAAKPPRGTRVFYADEVDIHLNPKIGYDYMLRGVQKVVLTPGSNQKRYLAGALDAQSGRLVWVEGTRKTSTLFVAMLERLLKLHPDAHVIHVIVDNVIIHKSRYTERALARLGPRIRLHFLPPYCPDDNRIERFWRDLHDNVTRNHRCSTMEDLMREVRHYLRNVSRSHVLTYRARSKCRRAA